MNFRLIYAGLLVRFYNHVTSDKSYNSIKSGWETTGVADVICPGLNNMPLVDPFHDIDPMLQPFPHPQTKTNSLRFLKLTLDKIQMEYLNFSEDESDEKHSESEDLEQERGAFDIYYECFLYFFFFLFEKNNAKINLVFFFLSSVISHEKKAKTKKKSCLHNSMFAKFKIFQFFLPWERFCP